MATIPHLSAKHEAERIMKLAAASRTRLRVAGGVGVALLCESANRPPLARAYADIDFVANHRDSKGVAGLFSEAGYEPELEFNALYGHKRSFFFDIASGHRADVFFDRIEACHILTLSHRLDVRELTISAADLLLSKLQVVETTTKDFMDIISLLADNPITDDDSGISRPRIVEVCANDWGWWRTATMVAGRAMSVLGEVPFAGTEVAAVAARRLGELVEELQRAPKSFRWRMRAHVGDHMRWHEEPEAIEHD
jgi:hypothetical protein